MKIKVTVLILSIILLIIAFDTIQAKLGNASPIIKIAENYNGGTLYQKDKGILVDNYKCTNKTQKTVYKWQKYDCPEEPLPSEKEINTFTKIIIDNKEMNIREDKYIKLMEIFDSLKYEKRECGGPIHYNVNIEGSTFAFYGHSNQVGHNNLCAPIDGNNLDNLISILDFVVSDNDMNNIENVNMKIKEGTLTKTGTTVIITDTNKEPYMYGLPFRLDRKQNNHWEKVKVTGNDSFILPGYYVDENNELELEQNWKGIYGVIPKGEYRLVKSVCVNDGCSKKKYFSVEFEIN